MAKKIKKVVEPAKQVVAKKEVKKTKCAAKKTAIKVSKPFSKSEIIAAIADMTCVAKKEAGAMLDALSDIIVAHVKKRSGVGEFTFPNVAKFKVVNKSATKARKGTNPFTGEPMTFAAKPARNVIKIKALKKIKDIAK